MTAGETFLSTNKFRVVSYLDRDNQEWFEVQTLVNLNDAREPNQTFWSHVAKYHDKLQAVALKRKLELPEKRGFKVIE